MDETWNGDDRRCMCTECNWRGIDAEVLVAPSPFDPEDRVNGCPKCKSVDSIVYACDEPGCWKQSSCGTPTPAGYRHTCGNHRPE